MFNFKEQALLSLSDHCVSADNLTGGEERCDDNVLSNVKNEWLETSLRPCSAMIRKSKCRTANVTIDMQGWHNTCLWPWMTWLGIVLLMSCYSDPLSHLFSVSLTLYPLALSGIPGKKCGSIIFMAEELSNCRVSTHRLKKPKLPTFF